MSHLNIALFTTDQMGVELAEYFDQQGFRVLLCLRRTANNRRLQFPDRLQGSVRLYSDLAGEQCFNELTEFQPDYLLCCVFGALIPGRLLAMPRIAAINIHPAPLPSCRGPNAWFWPIYLDHRTGSLSLHLMTERFDEGDVIAVFEFQIPPASTGGFYYHLVHQALIRYRQDIVKLLKDQGYTVTPQSTITDVSPHYYRGMNERDRYIDWSQSSDEVERRVRAGNPYFTAYFFYQDYTVICLTGEISTRISPFPGEISVDNGLEIGCADYCFRPTLVSINPVGYLDERLLVEFLGLQGGERLELLERTPLFCLSE